ncbi:MAG TPA: hypothetical protein P5121_39960, partial [Caldilineaceae bacterium]|nr:hypothetical protein [Caldilineaceae bacterium]
MQTYRVEKVIDQEPSTISQLAAQQVADAYLQTEIVAGLTTTSPVLIPRDPPIWRMLVRTSIRQIGG